CLSNKLDWANVALCVVTKINAGDETSIDKVSLKAGVRLTKDERKDVSGIGCRIVFANRRSMPTNVEDHILNRRSDYRTFALRECRMLNQGKLNKRIFLAPSPVAVKLLRQLHDLGWNHITRHYERRIIGDVISLLNQAHHGCSRTAHRLPTSQRVLATGVLRKHAPVHFLVQRKERVRLVSINLTDYDLLFARKLAFVKRRIARGVFHELECSTKIWTRSREVVFDNFFPGSAVVDDPKRANRS